MDSLNLSLFFHPKIEKTIEHKSYVEKVKISFKYTGSFGNTYIRLSYFVTFNDQFQKLPSTEKQKIMDTFQSPDFIFSLIPQSNHSTNREVEKRTLFRFLEFKQIYVSLISYITLQLDRHLGENIPIKVQGIDFNPYINYAEKYFNDIKNSFWAQEELSNSQFTRDAEIYNLLYNLALDSRKRYVEQKDLFKATDIDLANTTDELRSIRNILIRHKVPIRIKGIKTIDKIKIHIPEFIGALTKDIKLMSEDNYYSSSFGRQRISELKWFIEHIYENYLQDEKREIIEAQKLDYIKKFPIQQGDILELVDRRLVVAESITVSIEGCIELRYNLLKTNLEKGNRQRIIKLEKVSFYLKANSFNSFLEDVHIKRISLLGRWMQKKKLKVDNIPSFKANLVLL
ncbi:hypothetical protein [Sporocytophaga myxococcoides]|uniref:hypothetical protein n=1 Tax=Sporocytophaga myxococcoides TaxID=153721 RepID=UPI00040B1CF6|nr:hypothetical protein [Sporocytophaga myxococcoides]